MYLRENKYIKFRWFSITLGNLAENGSGYHDKLRKYFTDLLQTQKGGKQLIPNGLM